MRVIPCNLLSRLSHEVPLYEQLKQNRTITVCGQPQLRESSLFASDMWYAISPDQPQRGPNNSVALCHYHDRWRLLMWYSCIAEGTAEDCVQKGSRNIYRVTAEVSVRMELLCQYTDMCTVARRDERLWTVKEWARSDVTLDSVYNQMSHKPTDSTIHFAYQNWNMTKVIHNKFRILLLLPVRYIYYFETAQKLTANNTVQNFRQDYNIMQGLFPNWPISLS